MDCIDPTGDDFVRRQQQRMETLIEQAMANVAPLPVMAEPHCGHPAQVVPLPVLTRLDVPPDRILEAAVGKLEGVVLLGYDHDRHEYFASSYADGGTVLWLLERLKARLLGLGVTPG